MAYALPLTGPGPDQADVDAVCDLLDLMTDFGDNDQRARYLLTSNWLRDRGALASDRLRTSATGAGLMLATDRTRRTGPVSAPRQRTPREPSAAGPLVTNDGEPPRR